MGDRSQLAHPAGPPAKGESEMIDYAKLVSDMTDWENAKLSEIAGRSEDEIIRLIEADGQGVFWSRFGGWKFGRNDIDDDVSNGYITAEALWLNYNRPLEYW